MFGEAEKVLVNVLVFDCYESRRQAPNYHSHAGDLEPYVTEGHAAIVRLNVPHPHPPHFFFFRPNSHRVQEVVVVLEQAAVVKKHVDDAHREMALSFEARRVRGDLYGA